MYGRKAMREVLQCSGSTREGMKAWKIMKKHFFALRKSKSVLSFSMKELFNQGEDSQVLVRKKN